MSAEQNARPLRPLDSRRFTLDVTGPLFIYCLKVLVLSLLAATGLQGLATIVAQATGLPAPPMPNMAIQFIDWVGAVLLSPLMESLLLWAVGSVARSITRAVWAPSMVIGLIAGAAHGAPHSMWFFGPAASFAVFAWAWLRWRDAGRSHHFLILLVPHMLQNIVAMSLQALVERF